MIVHRLGTDTSVSFDWTDDDDAPVLVDTASFIVSDNAGDLVNLTDMTLTLNETFSVSLLIGAAEEALSRGNYLYSVQAVDAANGLRTLLSAGLLRVK